jgi:predicted nucleotidyltransferase
VTAYPELDLVLAEITAQAQDALGPAFVGAYVEGSFALGAGDLASDVDFFVVVDGPIAVAPRQRCERSTASCRRATVS